MTINFILMLCKIYQFHAWSFAWSVHLLTQRVELGEEGYTSEVDERTNDDNDEYRDGCCEAPHFFVYSLWAV